MSDDSWGSDKPDPNGESRPWRKSWRRRWREGSSYRSLTLLQREVLRCVEDHANDAGQWLTSYRHLAKLMSSKRISVSHSSIQDAISVLMSTVHITVHPIVNRGILLTRVNFREYQSQKGETVHEAVRITVHNKQRKQILDKSSTGRKAPEGLRELFQDLVSAYQQKFGESPDWGSDLKSRGALQGIRKVIPDDEVRRRWDLFLADKFWPVKNVFAFRKAYQKSGYLTKPKPVSKVRVYDGSESEDPTGRLEFIPTNHDDGARAVYASSSGANGNPGIGFRAPGRDPAQ